jgi:hypothetical protein
MAMRARRGEELQQAGDLVAVEAIDRTGLVITSEGAFVRVLRVTPPNPLMLSREDRETVAAGFCHLVGRLRPGQSLQFYIDARPVQLGELLAEARREVVAAAGPPPAPDRPARDATALSRWRLYAAMEETAAAPRRRAGVGAVQRPPGDPALPARARPARAAGRAA